MTICRHSHAQLLGHHPPLHGALRGFICSSQNTQETLRGTFRPFHSFARSCDQEDGRYSCPFFLGLLHFAKDKSPKHQGVRWAMHTGGR